MNRAEAGRFLTLRREMDGCQDDRAGVRMTGAEIVEEFLAEIVGRIDIEHEEVWVLIHDQLLRFLQAVRHVDVSTGRSLPQRRENGRGQIFIRRQDENPPALLGSMCGRC